MNGKDISLNPCPSYKMSTPQWTLALLLPLRIELDEDTPGYGKFYCVACSRYFQNAAAQTDHDATKPHKRK
jgi:hypothetical protein